MPFPSPRSAADRLLTFPARRPVVTLVLATAVLAWAAVGVARIRPDTSLASLFPRGNPSADALVHVLDAYPASGELILLASVPDGRPPAPEALASYAERFAAGVAASPDAGRLTAGVSYKADPDFQRFGREVLAPAGLYYLDDAAFAEARARLTPDGMREQFARNEALIRQPGPAAGAAAKQFLKDPLRLIEFVLGRLVGARPFRTYEGGETFVSPDGRAILIRVAGTASSSDLDYCGRLMAAVTPVAAAANADRLKLDFTGAYAAADFSHRAIRLDSIVSIAVSIVLLQLLFLVFYRRPVRQFLLEIAPVAIGVFVGFGAYGWIKQDMSPIAGVIGGILAGLGVDYSVLYLASYFRHLRDGHAPAEAVARTVRQAVGPMAAAWATAVIGFVAVAFSSIGTLRDFALLGRLGLGGAFAAVVLVLPAVVVLWDRRRLARSDTPAVRALPFRFKIERLLTAVDRRRRLLVGASLAVMVVAAALALTRPGGPLPLESDLHVMHPQPNPALATQRELVKRFGVDPAGGLMVHLSARSPDALVALAHDVDRRLAAPAVRAAGVSGSLGLASLLPDPTIVDRRRAAITPAEVERVVADFNAAVDASPFDPAAYADYGNVLRTLLLSQDAPTVASLLRYPALARNFLPSAVVAGKAEATEAVSLVFLRAADGDRAARDAVIAATRGAVAGLPGVTLTGLPVISLDAELAVRRDLPKLMAISIVAALAVLLAYFRSVRLTLLALTPLAFSLVVLAGAARVLDLKLNLINLVALPLLIGIDVDYGIYLVSLADARRRRAGGGTHPERTDGSVRAATFRERGSTTRPDLANGLPSPPPLPDGRGSHEAGAPDSADLDAAPLLRRVTASAQAVVVCAAASGLGFGALAAVNVPAVRSLGVAVGVGVAACLVGTFCLLAPLLMILDRRRASGHVPAPVLSPGTPGEG